METSILAGRLGQPGQKVPRSLGFSAPVTQSADVADVADAGAAAALELGVGE